MPDTGPENRWRRRLDERAARRRGNSHEVPWRHVDLPDGWEWAQGPTFMASPQPPPSGVSYGGYSSTFATAECSKPGTIRRKRTV